MEHFYNKLYLIYADYKYVFNQTSCFIDDLKFFAISTDNNINNWNDVCIGEVEFSFLDLDHIKE